MQTLKHPHPTQPGGRCPPRKRPRRVLLPYAALVVIGAALGGCGVEPIDLGDSTNPVKTLESLKCTSETQGGATSCKDEKTWSAYGAMACAGKGLVLNHISFATSCGAGLYREATYDCCTTSPPSPPPVPPRMCMWTPAVGPAACQTSDVWKKQGTAFCSAHGLQLNDLKLDRPCGAGGYGSAQFECCTTTPPPPPPPPPTMCTTETLAERSCVDDGTWKAKADAACKAKKLNLTALSFGAACMGGHLDVKFECCAAAPPPPPPPPGMCTTQVLVEKSCVDDGRWKAQAEAACKAKMQTLGTLAFGTACMGGHLDVKFECCGPTPPPPPPPGMCTTETLAERSCVDDATWKTRADAACKAKKLNLTALAFGAACMGGHTDIKFECCTTTPPPPPPPPMCTTDVLADKSCVDDGTWKTRADAACRAKMQTLSALSFGAACMGGHLEVKFECCGPMPPPPPPPPMCTKETIAAMTCIDDASWKTRAAATCAAKKLTLTAISYGHACMGGHQDVTFECCPVVTPPPPPMCTPDKAPSSGKCQTPAQWKTEGDTFCAAKKQTLTGLSMSGPCMGGFNEAEFECCGATPPPPPPTCSSGIVGDGRTCSTESALKSQAEGVCKMAGLRLTAFSPYDACGPMGQYLHAKYECCK